MEGEQPEASFWERLRELRRRYLPFRSDRKDDDSRPAASDHEGSDVSDDADWGEMSPWGWMPEGARREAGRGGAGEGAGAGRVLGEADLLEDAKFAHERHHGNDRPKGASDGHTDEHTDL